MGVHKDYSIFYRIMLTQLHVFISLKNNKHTGS